METREVADVVVVNDFERDPIGKERKDKYMFAFLFGFPRILLMTCSFDRYTISSRRCWLDDA